MLSIVGCWSTPLQWLCEAAGYLQELEHAVVHADPEPAYGREMNIQFTGNSSGGHSCSQHANCTLPQNLRHLWHCAV